jgi:hypothetical protein
MPWMHVYLPDDLYVQLKEAGMSASQLLQDAVRREIRLRELNRRTDEYLAEMDALYGPPTPEEIAEAEEWMDRVEEQLRASGRELPARRPRPDASPSVQKPGAMPEAG